MGTEARFQAIPEDCALLKRARVDAEIADYMQFFNSALNGILGPPKAPKNAEELFILDAASKLVQERPGLNHRYFVAARRTYDQIVYLLSAERRAGNKATDSSLIHKAIYGNEPLHPKIRASQGGPLGFVPTSEVITIAEYLSAITYEQLREHYDPIDMETMHVYKRHASDEKYPEAFQWIRDEFSGMTNVYCEAASHGEAMITVID